MPTVGCAKPQRGPTNSCHRMGRSAVKFRRADGPTYGCGSSINRIATAMPTVGCAKPKRGPTNSGHRKGRSAVKFRRADGPTYGLGSSIKRIANGYGHRRLRQAPARPNKALPPDGTLSGELPSGRWPDLPVGCDLSDRNGRTPFRQANGISTSLKAGRADHSN